MSQQMWALRALLYVGAELVSARLFPAVRTYKREVYTRCVNSDLDLLPALKRYWGYESFRPLQERIVRSLLGGRDVCVVMPTGGGKSLCYQLPAALSEKTAVVISPLIALMQDQVAQLTQMGIAAAVLNSSISAREQSTIMRNAASGQYRLLYLSPERLARADTADGCAHSRFLFSRSTKHTAFPNGATNFAPSTAC
jgi:superfamily II DNA helicase RecQ